MIPKEPNLRQTSNNTSNEKIKSILYLLKKGEAIHYESHENIVLFLGNTGSGKSTVTQLIAGDNNNLISQEVGEEDTGEFIIIDNANRISGNSTITSQTIFPEMVKDLTTNTIFYDCPGFSDTRSLAHDITVTYLIKKIIDSAKAVKLVFVISYPSVRRGVDRHDFMLLLKHATGMIKNIDKFKDSITLVVTKVDNETVGRWGKYILVSDQKIMHKIGDFLKLVKVELAKLKLANPLNDPDFYENGIKFIDILLTKHEGDYGRIGIFRRPDMAGMVSRIPILQEGRAKLLDMIHNNVQFASHTDRDFGYTISAESKNYIHDLTHEINNAINTNVESVGRNIKKHFVAIENKFSDLEYLQNQFQTGDYLLKGLKNGNKFLIPRDIVNPLITTTSGLNILAGKHLYEILNYDKYLKFIQTVNGGSSNNPLIWTQGLTNVIDYVSSSRKWYRFLTNFFNILSDYDIQQNVENYDANYLEYQITSSKLKIKEENREIKVKDIDLKQLLDQVGANNYQLDYSDLADIILNEPKLNALKKLLEETLNYKPTLSYPTSNKLVIKGQYIKLRDIISKIAPENIETVEIFALQKIFIDSTIDKVGHKAKISIVAPVWQIVKHQKILLDGKPATTHYSLTASNAQTLGDDGSNGQSGNPGGSAGHFVGIGDTFVNGEYLSISANGGKGGPGQHGGNGADGAKGEDPPLPYDEECDTWKRGGFNFTILYDYRNWEHTFFIFGRRDRHTVDYRVNGTKGTNGGNGGDGGIGGEGGHNGTIKLIEINKKSNIFTNALAGATGQPGIGGKPGKNGTHGQIMYITYHRQWETSEKYPTKRDYWNKKYENYSLPLFSGTTGRTGLSLINRKYPQDVIFPDVSPFVNAYKQYLRQNLETSTNELFLKKFHNYLEQNPYITDFNDTLALISEFFDLEYLSGKVKDTTTSLLSFYDAFLHRISKYSNNPKSSETSLEYKKVLSYLYVAVLSKICYIDRHVDANLKLNLNKYLESITKNINSMKEINNISVGAEYYLNEQREINNRITETKQFIHTQIKTDINNINNKIDEQVDLLLTDTIIVDEIVENKNVVIIEDELEEAEEDAIRKAEQRKESIKREQQLKETVILRAMLGSVEMSHEYLTFITALASALTAAQDVAINKSLLLGDFNKEKANEISAMLSSVQDSIEKIENRRKNNLDLFLTQLHDVEQKLRDFLQQHPSSNLNKLLEKILFTLEDGAAKGVISDESSLYAAREDIMKLIKFNKLSLEQNSTENNSVEKQLELLKLMQDILTIENVSVNVYDKIKTNHFKIKKLARSVQEASEVFNKIKLYNTNLYKLTSLKDIRDNIRTLSRNLHTAASITINIKDWNIQKTLKDVKNQLQLLANESNVDEELKLCIGKLELSISFMVNVYDNIENVKNQAQLAAYISDIDSAKSAEIKVENHKLLEAVDKLDKVIKSNLIAGQYNKAVAAFQKHVFPFASSYDEDLSLPGYAKLKYFNNSVNEFADQVITKIKQIQSKNLESAEMFGQYDSYIHNQVKFNSNYVQMSPFSVWQYDTIKESASKLLDGKEITIKADLFKGVDKNVIKFNQIGIRFKLHNDTLQEQFDKLLHDFGVTMTHHGDSHYKCGDDISVVISDKTAIYYSFKKNDAGEPIDTNKVYDKIKHNHFMLSPYATWNIKISNVNDTFDIIKDFKNEEMAIELEGNGQYIDKEVDVCNELENYYKVDQTLSDLDNDLYSVEKLKRELAEEVSPSNSDISRGRRDLQDVEPQYVSSGASSNTQFSILHNILYALGERFEALKHLDPVTTVNEWFTSTDKKINVKEVNNDYSLPYDKMLNSQSASINDSKLQIHNSNLKTQFDCKVPDIQSNLLLLDLLVKMKKRNRNKSSDFHQFNGITDHEYAHRLAYNAYISK